MLKARVATAAAAYARDDRVEQVLICSPDKDMAQCVRGERVVMVDRRRRKIIDEPGLVDKFGVSPASIPDWRDSLKKMLQEYATCADCS